MAVQNHCFVLFRPQETSECQASSAPRDSRVRSQIPQAKAGEVRVLDVQSNSFQGETVVLVLLLERAGGRSHREYPQVPSNQGTSSRELVTNCLSSSGRQVSQMLDSWTATGELGFLMCSLIPFRKHLGTGFIACLLCTDQSEELQMHPIKTTLFSLQSQGTSEYWAASFQSQERQESVPWVAVKKVGAKKFLKV